MFVRTPCGHVWEADRYDLDDGDYLDRQYGPARQYTSDENRAALESLTAALDAEEARRGLR